VDVRVLKNVFVVEPSIKPQVPGSPVNFYGLTVRESFGLKHTRKWSNGVSGFNNLFVFILGAANKVEGLAREFEPVTYGLKEGGGFPVIFETDFNAADAYCGGPAVDWAGPVFDNIH
jgi:hypothetical protein